MSSLFSAVIVDTQDLVASLVPVSLILQLFLDLLESLGAACEKSDFDSLLSQGDGGSLANSR